MLAGLEYIDADGAGTKKVAILWAFCIYGGIAYIGGSFFFLFFFWGGIYLYVIGHWRLTRRTYASHFLDWSARGLQTHLAQEENLCIHYIVETRCSGRCIVYLLYVRIEKDDQCHEFT